MKLSLRKSFTPYDWYTIERWVSQEELPQMEEFEQLFFRIGVSMPISDAPVEGTKEQMRAIAEAIKARSSVSFRLCSVRVMGEFVYFCNPKHSGRYAEVPLSVADEFADEVLAALS